LQTAVLSDAAVFGRDIFFRVFGAQMGANVLQEAYQLANRQGIDGHREQA